MDTEDLRSLLRDAGVDLWTLIDAAISAASRDHAGELRARRDAIVELLYARAAAAPPPRCRNCDAGDAAPPPRGVVRSNNAREEEEKGSSSPAAAAGKQQQQRSPPTPQSMSRAAEEEEGEEDEEEGEDRSPDSTAKSKILAIKEFLDLEDQSDDQVASLLQNLADLEVTFRALKETDIGRHVNGLRKHPSGEVRRLVKLLVRKWKDIVDEWVKSNEGEEDPRVHNHGKSNGHHQVPDFGYSPVPHNGGSSERAEGKAKAPAVVRKEPVAPLPVKQNQGTPVSASQAKVKEGKDSMMDAERLAAARRRLQENYQEAQNAKKQRTIQVMDIHEIPKAKNAFTARGRGGGSHHQQAKHW